MIKLYSYRVFGLEFFTLNSKVNKMPWEAEDAKHHTKKANTPERQSLWAGIANERLRKGASEGSAIRQANAALKRIKHGE